MFVAVRDFTIANATALTELPAIAEFVDQFNEIVTQIQSTSTQHQIDTTGLAVSKAVVKEELITRALTISRNLVAYARVVGNDTLKAEIDFTLSEMRKAPDLVLKENCEVICMRATANLEETETYNITEAMITDLQTQITAFSTVMSTPKSAIVERKAKTDKLKVLFNQGDAILKNKIDAIIEMTRIINPDFYNSYRRVRTMRNEFGTHKLALKVNVTDNLGAPVANVVVTLDGTRKTRKTTEKGSFQVDLMQAGVYTFHFSKSGYKPVTAIVNVNDGETTKVNVVMEKVLESVGVPV